MEAKEYPFYGIGIIAYVVANADGQIQGRERNELKAMIHEWSERLQVNFDITEIVFSLMVKTNSSEELTYEKGLHYITLGKEHLTESLKEKFIFLIKDVAHAFPPVTLEEGAIIKRLEQDIKHL